MVQDFFNAGIVFIFQGEKSWAPHSKRASPKLFYWSLRTTVISESIDYSHFFSRGFEEEPH